MMAILENHFYNKTIKLYTAVFGTVFNDMSIIRSDGKEVKVPIAYAGQQKQNVRIDEESERPNVRHKMNLPRMAFRLVGWEKDESRITNKRHVLQDQQPDRTSVNSVQSQYNRVPYNFDYELIVKTKHVDDMLQIVEQILVYFNPGIEIVVNDNETINASTAINLELNGSNFEDNFEGLYEDGRSIEATFNFTLEGYLYTPSQTSGIIKQINLNYYDLLDPDTILESDVIDESDL